MAMSLKTCLNLPRGRGGKGIGTLASEDGWYCDQCENDAWSLNTKHIYSQDKFDIGKKYNCFYNNDEE